MFYNLEVFVATCKNSVLWPVSVGEQTQFGLACLQTPDRLSRIENLSLGGFEQYRRRPACASAQSDQRLCYLLFGKNHM